MVLLGKKAISEMLDGQVADMKKDFPQGKGGPNKTPKEKDPKAEAAKKLQKDIKAFLV